MHKVNLMISTPLAPELVEQIRLVSPTINIIDASSLVMAEFLKNDAAAAAQLHDLMKDVEIIFGWIPPRNVIDYAPHLKWVQLMSAGADHVLVDEKIRQSSLTLTNTGGIHPVQVGELVLTMMLMLAKQSQTVFHMKQRKEWYNYIPYVLNSATVGIVGLGNIGREVARLSKALGMRVIALDVSARTTKIADHIDLFLPPEEVSRLISDSDYVILCVPLTSETKGLIGEKQLRAMKPSAFIINISRGEVIDEAALIRALEEHWIAGAGLDTFVQEPLPASSRFWDMPNLIISPHVAGKRTDYDKLATDLFCKNLKLYLEGKPLQNVVDKSRGF